MKSGRIHEIQHNLSANKQKEISDLREEMYSKLDDKSNEVMILEQEVTRLIEENQIVSS